MTLTAMAEKYTLAENWFMLLWLLACSLAAFLATLAGFELQAWIWPRTAETREGALPQPTALLTPIGSEAVGEGMNELPTPAGAREVYALSKPDPWGGRFQGFYETEKPAAEVIAFYRQVLPARGLRLDSSLSSALSRAEAGKNLAFMRGQQRLLLTVFEA
ncbi:MAG: hypothetical protein N3A66_03645 [Planctomycetota bacterium]|nr:hypothetical protein [Planctomycetota bacterium]